MRKLIGFFFTVALLVIGQTALSAYGPTGHEIVGAIADMRLANTSTSAKLQAIISGLTLERASTIPDEIKAWDGRGSDDLSAYPQYPETPAIEQQLRAFWKANPPPAEGAANDSIPSHHWFHYTDVPVFAPEKYADGKVGRSQWDLVHMVRYCVQVLRGEIPANNDRKITPAVAVILLAHYVGDIHQPLHVGAEYFSAGGATVDPDKTPNALEDQGGNSVLLDLLQAGSTNNRRLRLHGFWDNEVVMAQFNNLPVGLNKKERTAAINSGPKQQLVSVLAKTEPPGWQLTANTPTDDLGEAWANDILPQAREAYERLSFSNVHVRPDGKNKVAEANATEKEMPDGLSYRDWSARVVRKDLQKAGWRLAYLLQQSLSGGNVASAAPAAANPLTSPAATITPTPTASVSPTITPKPVTPTPTRGPIDPVYGRYPNKYKAIIMDWFFSHLHDPLSAQVEWQTEPRKADLPGPNGKPIYGYLVLVTVNARSMFGNPTGKQSHGFLIHEDVIVKTTGFAYGRPKRR